MRFVSILLLALGAAFTTLGQSLPTGIGDINPFIGTGAHGHTHPSAQAPFGMIQLGPNTRYTGWDGCSGYHYTDSVLLGFSTTHLSGTGVSDYGDILIGPSRADGELLVMDKSSEQASAGHYKIALENGLIVEATAAERAGILRLVFPEDRAAVVEIDLSHRDHVHSSSLTELDSNSWHGHRYSAAWATNQKWHFYMESNVPGSMKQIDSLRYLIDFKAADTVELSIGVSGTDIQGAQNNFTATDHIHDFGAMLAMTRRSWASELNKSVVYHEDPDWRAVYATALYHAYSVPNLWSDVDGRYRGMDDQIHLDTDHQHYTIFSLWDTYRTAHPLYTITQPERTVDFLNGFLDMFDQYGRLPVWELAANETNCMIGYHSVSVIADALAKGYPIDTARAIEAMTETATSERDGITAYMKYGFLSIEDESESVSKTLEYAYDDACIAMAAKRLGEPTLERSFKQRATAYRSLVDPESGWMRPRNNGRFIPDFDPRQVNNHFTEANSYQYSFAPVHDLDHWKKMLATYLDKPSGEAALYDQLEALFNAPEQTTGRTQSDITGLYGQYAHGNEPSHHIAYLYNATDSVHKTQERVWDILHRFYQNDPEGLSGNEDCGQMSAWFVMASWGLYPLVPGEPRYALSTPFWDRIELTVAPKKAVVIETSGDGPYIAEWSTGQDVNSTWIDHETLRAAGSWVVKRSEKPTAFGRANLYSNTLNNATPPAPVIDLPISISEKTTGTVKALTPNSVRVTATGEIKTKQKKNEVVLTASGSGSIEAEALHFGYGNHISRSQVVWRDDRWSAEWTKGTPNKQYTAGGPTAMVDGIRGETVWRKGNWVGIQGEDAELVLTAIKTEEVSAITVGALKEIRSWIAFPEAISVWTDNGDGAWVLWGRQSIENPLGTGWEDEPEIRNLRFEAPKGVKKAARIKVVYENAGPLPYWHLGAGGESFFFVDEVEVSE